MSHWYLEGLINDGRVLLRLPLEELPVVIGRERGLALADCTPLMSRRHAEIDGREGGLVLRDLGSTNGTFVNHAFVSEETRLRDGDIIHFADAEFRVCREVASGHEDPTTTGVFEGPLSGALPTEKRNLIELLDTNAVTALFHPVVTLSDERVFAYECLGRGSHAQLSDSPTELFRIAEAAGSEVRLSEMMRHHGVALARSAGVAEPLFVNIHPLETREPDRLLDDLGTIRQQYPQLTLVLEIHERALSSVTDMAAIRARLRDLGVGLAYDDFGAGQARFMELAEVPPDYLKFDMSLVRDIDRAGAKRQEMLQMLVRFARETGIDPVAEGVSRRGEARACRELGFELAQGFLFGHPAPLDDQPPDEPTGDGAGPDG